jgi:hypothetical protein
MTGIKQKVYSAAYQFGMALLEFFHVYLNVIPLKSSVFPILLFPLTPIYFFVF